MVKLIVDEETERRVLEEEAATRSEVGHKTILNIEHRWTDASEFNIVVVCVVW